MSFDDATVERLLATEAITPRGAACLTLACQNRTALNAIALALCGRCNIGADGDKRIA
jgi:hypothetical protein